MEVPMLSSSAQSVPMIRFRRFLASLLLLGCLPMMMQAQTRARSAADAGLPDAPGMFGQAAEAQVKASINGVVTDVGGGLVPDAKVTLLEEGSEERAVTSGSDGSFTFADLPAGHFNLKITAAGLETFESSEINLRLGERYEFPRIDLPVAALSTDVSVVITQHELAQDQIRDLEKQRLFGVLPNFYSSYVWDAAPWTAKQKFGLALHSIGDPVSIVLTGVVAGVQQAQNTYPAYGQGAQGYGKRFGADFADDAIGRMLVSAVLPSLFHQDPRYFYRGSGSTWTRAVYAVRSAVVTKGDNGRWQADYSHVLGAFAAGGISNAYHPAVDRGAGLTVKNGFLAIGGHAADNLIREFVLRHITPKVPSYEKGKAE
jgi:hypothetical protein